MPSKKRVALEYSLLQIKCRRPYSYNAESKLSIILLQHVSNYIFCNNHM